jgi:uncharacterized protein YegP (UPF0339 family)
MFRDPAGHWRWNFASAGGIVIAASKVAYFHKEGCVRAIRTMRGSAGAPVWGPEADVEPLREAQADERAPEMAMAQ